MNALNLIPQQEGDKFPGTFFVSGCGIDSHGVLWNRHPVATVVKQDT